MADYGATGGNAVEMYDGSILTFGNFVRAGSDGFFTTVGTTLDVTYPSLDNSLAFQELGYSSENPHILAQIDERNFFGEYIDVYFSSSIGPTTISTFVGVYFLNDDGSYTKATQDVVLPSKYNAEVLGLNKPEDLPSSCCKITFAKDPFFIEDKNPQGLGFFSYYIPNKPMFDSNGTLFTNREWVAPETWANPNYNVDGFGNSWLMHTQFMIMSEDGSVKAPDTKEGEPTPSMPSPSGGGGFDGHSENDTFPPLPSLGSTGSGFVQLYNPTTSELQALGGYLWSNDFLDNIAKIFQDPMDLIITLNVVPCAPAILNTSRVYIGSLDTHIDMLRISSEYVAVNCGRVTIPEYYGSALDYAPHTKISLLLPFVGVVPLNADECSNSTLEVQYNISVFTGNAMCFVKVTKFDAQGTNANGSVGTMSNVLYSYPCQISNTIEISSKNYSQFYSSVIGGIGKTALGAASGGVGKALGEGAQSAINTMSTKPTIERSGGASGTAGILGERIPKVIIERPIQSYPSNFNQYEGLPSNITATVGSLRGFTKFEKIEMKGLKCSQNDIDEIETLLTEGIYI